MAEITKELIRGNAAALRLIKTVVDMPTLIALGNPTFYIPLEVDQFSVSGEAQISEQLVIAVGQDVKKSLSDNVAPSGWTWQLGGYIPGNTALEPSNKFTPMVKLHTDLIMQAFRRGTRMTFKDLNCRPFTNVVIQSLGLHMEPDCQNKQPFTMTLKQIEVIKGVGGNFSGDSIAEAPAGGKFGAALDGGNGTATKIEGDNKTFLKRSLTGGISFEDILR